jgi:hypothetical protein
VPLFSVWVILILTGTHITVYFSLDVATGEAVDVMLRADFYTTERVWISQEETLKIAESVVLVD